MAIYYCKFKMITRYEGRSAVAAAAYRSGEKITNIWDGVEHDYSRKGGIVYKNILLPGNAPPGYKDRSILWKEVELSEKASDSRLCRECVLALPRELSQDQQIRLTEEYAKKNFVDSGMCADITIHDPILTDDLHHPINVDGAPTNAPSEFQRINPHAHILLTLRPIAENGKWEAKTQKEYLCKRGDKQQEFTAEEFKTMQDEGWEKQYRYRTPENKKAWMTPSEAAESGLSMQDRVSRSPRSTPHGRENQTCASWNDKASLIEWRRSWAEMANRKLKKVGSREQIDHRSYAEQGIDKLPQEHMGPSVNVAEKRAKRLERENCQKEPCHTELGERNLMVADYNRSEAKYRKTKRAASKKVFAAAARMEHLRAMAIYSGCSASALGRLLAASVNTAEQKNADIQNSLQLVEAMITLNEKSAALIASLTESLRGAGMRERKELQDRISQEEKTSGERAAYVDSIMRKNGFSDINTLRTAAKLREKEQDSINKQKEILAGHEKRLSNATEEYRVLRKSVPALYRGILTLQRISVRPTAEADYQQRLKRELGDQFSISEYRKTAQKTDKALSKKYGEREPVRNISRKRYR
ncbi:MAG: MobA/MobL family protein [Clostridiales bacterium]|nr:MobA/MobL family protein [Clostridiales bacterium]